MIHDMIMAAAGQAAGPVGPTDADFQNTVLLLHGDGTNGAQNNTFLDSSTNNFTITRNGNTTQGTFSPFSKPDGRWGNYFDGSDQLSMPSNSAFAFGTGAYTVEAWVYLTQYTSFGAFVFDAGSATNSFGLVIQSTGAVDINKYGGSSVFSTSSGAVSLNAWTHIAVVRTSTGSNDTKIYVNGVLSATGTDNNDWTVTTTPKVGGLNGSFDVFGYISNLRVVKSAVYSSAFTPSTTPLTAITNTSLLTCQSNRFIDNSSNAFAITRNGDVKVTPFSPFPITTAYDPAVNGGAGYFDGSGDYVDTPSDSAFAVGSAFTVEAWVYPTVSMASGAVFASGTATNNWQFGHYSSNQFGLAAFGTAWRITSSTALTIGAWNHCVFVRSGTGSNQASLFLNGVRVANGTVSDAFTTNQIVRSGNSFTGHLSQVRVVKGSAVYDPSQTTITVPTAPLTAVSGTSLLLNFNNAGILDNTGFNALETVGNAQIDTTTKKYGTGSMEFDGTGDWLVIPASPHLIFSGSFTVEFWLYWNSVAASFNTLVVGTSANTQLFLNTKSNGTGLRFGLTGVAEYATGTKTWSTGQWYHIALVRNGSSIKFYVDGTDITDSTPTNTTTYSGILQIGGNGGGGTVDLNGLIDDLRITNGIARYTTTFTPPTAALPDIGE